jgi:hypothetical protein
MSDAITIAKAKSETGLLLQMANRMGLIAGRLRCNEWPKP